MSRELLHRVGSGISSSLRDLRARCQSTHGYTAIPEEDEDLAPRSRALTSQLSPRSDQLKRMRQAAPSWMVTTPPRPCRADPAVAKYIAEVEAFIDTVTSKEPATGLQEILSRLKELKAASRQLNQIQVSYPYAYASFLPDQRYTPKELLIAVWEKIRDLEERHQEQDNEEQVQRYLRAVRWYIRDAFDEETVTEVQDVLDRLNHLKKSQHELAHLIKHRVHGAASRLPPEHQPNRIYEAICEKMKVLEATHNVAKYHRTDFEALRSNLQDGNSEKVQPWEEKRYFMTEGQIQARLAETTRTTTDDSTC